MCICAYQCLSVPVTVDTFPYMGFNGPFISNVSLSKCCKYTIIIIGLWSPAADQHLVSDANPQVSHSESQIPSLARKSETTTRAIMVETFLPLLT